MIALTKNMMKTTCRTARQRCISHDKDSPGERSPKKHFSKGESFDAIFPKKTYFGKNPTPKSLLGSPPAGHRILLGS
jgi:hypothetical protein